MGQPGFDPTLKRPGMGHRLCNPFRTTRFFYPNPHGSNPNPIDLTRLPGLRGTFVMWTNHKQLHPLCENTVSHHGVDLVGSVVQIAK